MDFNKTVKEANESWKTKLKKIEVKGKEEKMTTFFYTALYHAYIAPNTFMDVNRNYRGHMAKSIPPPNLMPTPFFFTLGYLPCRAPLNDNY